MHVLITGGAGYVGYSLVKHLLEDRGQEHSITIYDNLSRKNLSFFTEAQFGHRPVKFIEGDLLDSRSLSQALKGVDAVVHLAAKVTTPFADSDAHSFDQINHWGSAQLAYAVEQSDVKSVIYLSSISIYGEQAIAVTEDSAPHPQSFYGRSKYEGERQIDVLSRAKKVWILRSGNVYGYNPAYRIDAVINRFLFQTNFSGTITINGSGDQHRSFIHVDKLAYAICETLNDRIDPGTYNVVEHNLSIHDISSLIKELYPKTDIIHANYNLRMKDIFTAVPCRIWSAIPLPQRTLQEELADFKAHFSF